MRKVTVNQGMKDSLNFICKHICNGMQIVVIGLDACIVLLLNSLKTASTPHLNDNHRFTAIYFLRIPITLIRGLRAEGLGSNGVMEFHDPYKKSCPVKVDDKKDGRILVAKGWPDCCQNQLVNEGDTVVFDFVMQRVVKLHIFRGKECCVVLEGPKVKN